MERIVCTAEREQCGERWGGDYTRDLDLWDGVRREWAPAQDRTP